MDSDQPGREPSSTVVGFDRTDQSEFPGDLDRWTGLAAETLAGEGVTEGRLDLIFVGPDEMAELNEAHMGHQGPTDVLSFPLDAPNLAANEEPEPGPETHLVVQDLVMPDLVPQDLDMLELIDDGDDGQDPTALHLGDVIVCPEVARQQAPDHCGDPETELSLLIVHGVLHILGHDHAEPAETEVMQSRERHHLTRLGYRHPAFDGGR